jgi:hypothetical protein
MPTSAPVEGVLTNYTAAVAFVNLIAVGIPLWDRRVPAETNVEDTLWLCLAVFAAVVITAVVELAFVPLQPGDEVVLPIGDRLSAVEDLSPDAAEPRFDGLSQHGNVCEFTLRWIAHYTLVTLTATAGP